MVFLLRKEWSHWPCALWGNHYSYYLKVYVQGQKIRTTNFCCHFPRRNNSYFYKLPVLSYANILSSKGAGRTNGSILLCHLKCYPSPQPTAALSSKNDAMCHSPETSSHMIHCKHTAIQHPTAYHVYGINTWKLNIVHHEGKSWFHLFS